LLKVVTDQQRIKDETLSAGQRLLQTYQVLDSTTVISIKPGIAIRQTFGCKAANVGAPKGAKVPIRVVWHFPQPGLTNPETGVTQLRDEYVTTSQPIGDENYYYSWTVQPDWTKVPGLWTLELFSGQRLLGSQTFTLTK
jgi:hypothetical protein